MINDIYQPRDLYPDKNGYLRFEYLANISRLKSRSELTRQRNVMGIVFTKYPYMNEIFNCFEKTFDKIFPYIGEED